MHCFLEMNRAPDGGHDLRIVVDGVLMSNCRISQIRARSIRTTIERIGEDNPKGGV